MPIIKNYASGATELYEPATPEQLERRAKNKNENRDPRWVDATEAQRQRAREKGMKFPDVARPTWLAHYVLDVRGMNVHHFMSNLASMSCRSWASSMQAENVFKAIAGGKAEPDGELAFMLRNACMKDSVSEILAPYTPEGEEPAEDLGNIAQWFGVS